jgi:hypothetical protein
MDIEYNEIPARVRAQLDSDPRLPCADGVAVDGVTGVTNHIEVVERLCSPAGLPASASRL